MMWLSVRYCFYVPVVLHMYVCEICYIETIISTKANNLSINNRFFEIRRFIFNVHFCFYMKYFIYYQNINDLLSKNKITIIWLCLWNAKCT